MQNRSECSLMHSNIRPSIQRPLSAIFNHNLRLTKTGSSADITSNKHLDLIKVLPVMLGCLQSRIKPSTTSSTTLQALVYQKITSTTNHILQINDADEKPVSEKWPHR